MGRVIFMIEWITTGKLIDRLQPGEVAEDEMGLRVEKKNDGLVYKVNGQKVILTDEFMSKKWRILPQYVTFSEAMKAHEEGKTVNFHDDETSPPKKITQNDLKLKLTGSCLGDYSLIALYKGKWTIEP
jgi:hypothetical protein